MFMKAPGDQDRERQLWAKPERNPDFFDCLSRVEAALQARRPMPKLRARYFPAYRSENQCEDTEMKPFTTIAAIVLLIVAAAHVYRLVASVSVSLDGHILPMWISWAGAAFAALLGVMLIIEARR